MKTIRYIATALIALTATAAALVAKPIPGPKGGRILTSDAPHAEFFVQKDRTVVVSFYDKALKPVPSSGQIVSATAETKSGKVKLDFAEKNGALVSKTAFSCPHCGADLETGAGWRQSRGAGVIASYSVVVRAVNPELHDDAPYVIAFVDLDEGVRLFSNIVDAKPEDIRSGLRVQCRFEPSLDPELWVPVFVLKN